MNNASLYERLVEFVKQKSGHVSFIEFQNEFSEIKGDWDFVLSEFNLILWPNVTTEFIEAIDHLIRNDILKFAPCEPLVYIGDGVILDYPVANNFKKYPSLKWFPVVFDLV